MDWYYPHFKQFFELFLISATVPLALAPLVIWLSLRAKTVRPRLIFISLYLTICSLWVAMLLPALRDSSNYVRPDSLGVYTGSIIIPGLVLLNITIKLWKRQRSARLCGFQVIQTHQKQPFHDTDS